MADIVRRAGFGTEFGQCIGPFVPAGRDTGVFIGKSGDLDIREFEIPGHAVQHHGRVRTFDRVMVEMGVGGHGDVDRDLREFVAEPQTPGARRVIPPRVEQNRRAAGRGDLERTVTVIVDADRSGAGLTGRPLQVNHMVVVARLQPGLRLRLGRFGAAQQRCASANTCGPGCHEKRPARQPRCQIITIPFQDCRLQILTIHYIPPCWTGTVQPVPLHRA